MKTYPLTTTGFDALRTKLLSMGVTLPSDSDGTLSHDGVTLKYRYDGTALTLSIQQKPFYVPASLIWDEVDGWLSASPSV